MRNPTRYTIEEVIGWEEFERLCISVLFAKGHRDIKSAGKVKDGGRDAVILVGSNEHTIFQISKEKDPLNETKRHNKKPSKFWREYDRWAGITKTKKFVFISSQSLGSKKIDLMKSLKNPRVAIIDLDEIENFLDYDETGKLIKKEYAIFSRDLQEIFGASNRGEKLNEVAKVINEDEHYNIATVLSSTQNLPPKGTVFSSHEGDVARYFIPKSFEHYQSAVPTVNMTLAAPNTKAGKTKLDGYIDAMRHGRQVTIPSGDIKDLRFAVGNKTFFEGVESGMTVSLGPVSDDTPRKIVLRSRTEPEVFIRSELLVKGYEDDKVFMDNHEVGAPLDIRIIMSKTGEVNISYKFSLEKCLDVSVAYAHARMVNAIQNQENELSFDDQGIERILTVIPPRKGKTLDEGSISILRDMSKIQNYFKTRIPNPFGDIAITQKDRWSIKTLIELIENGKVEVDVSRAKFALATKDIAPLVGDEVEVVRAISVGGNGRLTLVSVLGVNDFPGLELVFPSAKLRITKIDEETSSVDVEAIDKPYLKILTEDKKTPASASWNS